MLELSRGCIPYTPLKRELKDCRIALVSTSGAYVEGMQPFGENDLSYRLIPADTDTKNLRFVPGHFDTSKGAEDPNIMFPLDRLRELYPEGRFEVRRFRPNIVVRPDDAVANFVESEWVGRELRVGDDVVLQITDHCPRCVRGREL